MDASVGGYAYPSLTDGSFDAYGAPQQGTIRRLEHGQRLYALLSIGESLVSSCTLSEGLVAWSPFQTLGGLEGAQQTGSHVAQAILNGFSSSTADTKYLSQANGHTRYCNKKSFPIAD